MTEGAEGRIEIWLGLDAGRVSGVELQSTRPLRMPEIFRGRTPAELTATLPLIYSVCGVAQGCAAAEALEQALACEVSSSIAGARRLLVSFETVKEHLWRIGQQWSGFLQRPADKELIIGAVGLMKTFRAALFAKADPFRPGGGGIVLSDSRLESLLDRLDMLLQQRIFILPAAEWLGQSKAGELESWMNGGGSIASDLLRQVCEQGLAGIGRTPVHPLPDLAWAALNRRFEQDGEAFIARPDWQGGVAETGPFTRQLGHPLLRSILGCFGNGLLPRLAARLLELAWLAGDLREGVRNLGQAAAAAQQPLRETGTGIAQIEASRGRLIHRVELSGGLVARYQILAPTEWNFHPRGVLALGLQGLQVAGEADLRRKAELLINAVDPCVGYRLEIARPPLPGTR